MITTRNAIYFSHNVAWFEDIITFKRKTNALSFLKHLFKGLYEDYPTELIEFSLLAFAIVLILILMHTN